MDESECVDSTLFCLDSGTLSCVLPYLPIPTDIKHTIFLSPPHSTAHQFVMGILVLVPIDLKLGELSV